MMQISGETEALLKGLDMEGLTRLHIKVITQLKPGIRKWRRHIHIALP
jgi:hypothetical protein